MRFSASWRPRLGRAVGTSSKPMEDDALLRTVADLVLEHGLVAGRCDPDAQRVVDFVPPEDLARRLGGLEIRPGPATGEEARRTMEDVIRHSVKTAHPRFFNQASRNGRSGAGTTF